MSKFAVDGVVYEQVDMDRLTLGEIGVLEKVTGLTINAIARKLQTCVCDHLGEPDHVHLDDDPKAKQNTSCKRCGCHEFSDITPSEFVTAMVWLSMKRQEPALPYVQAQQITQESIERIPDPVHEDVDGPKAVSLSKTGEPGTSPASPSISDSNPGTSTGSP